MPGGGAGSILDMIVRYRSNMQLRNKTIVGRKKTFLNHRKEYVRALGGELEYRKATPEQLAAVRSKIIKQRRRERVIRILIIVAFVPLLSLGLNELVKLNKAERLYIEQLKNTDDKELSETYQFYMNDGDKWLEAQHWTNAAYQYYQALLIFPGDYDASYKLAYVYTYSCRDDSVNCSNAKELLNRLIIRHPDKVELYELRASYFMSVGDTTQALADYDRSYLLESSE